MKEIHDIRQSIPQFTANHFPQYKYQAYPRMMVNRDTGKPYLDAIRKPVKVDSMEAEIEFWASKGFKATLVTNPRTDVVETTLAAIGEAPVADKAPKAVEIPVAAPAVAAAPAEVAAASSEQAPKRRGRPPANKLPADLK